MAEVHAVDAGDERGDDEDRAPRRHLLHHLVELVGRDREVGLEQPGEQVALRLDEITDPEDAVVDVVEVHDGLFVDEVDLPADDRVHDLAHGRGASAQGREVAAHGEDLPRDRGRRIVGEHDPFDLVEPVVDRIGHFEVPVDDHVEERPQQEALFGRAVLGPLQFEAAGDLVEVDRGAGLGGMADRDQPSGTGDDVDLPADHRRSGTLAIVHGDVEVVAVAHQLGAFPRVEDGVDDGRADAEPFAQGADLGFGRRRGVDPDDRLIRRHRIVETIEVDGLPAVATDDVPPHPDHAAEHTLGAAEGEVPANVERSVRTQRRGARGDHARMAGRTPPRGLGGGGRRRGLQHGCPTARRPRLREVVHRVRRVRLRHADLARRVRGRFVAVAGPGACGERGTEHLQGAPAVEHHRHRYGRADGDRVGERGRQAAVPARDRHQRGDLVSAVQRTGCRFRRRRPGHPRRT